MIEIKEKLVSKMGYKGICSSIGYAGTYRHDGVNIIYTDYCLIWTKLGLPDTPKQILDAPLTADRIYHMNKIMKRVTPGDRDEIISYKGITNKRLKGFKYIWIQNHVFDLKMLINLCKMGKDGEIIVGLDENNMYHFKNNEWRNLIGKSVFDGLEIFNFYLMPILNYTPDTYNEALEAYRVYSLEKEMY